MTMTTLELHPNETLRDHVRRLRRMRHDGIVVSARQALLGSDSGDVVEFVPLGDKRWLVAVIDAKSRGPAGAEIARDVARLISSRAPNTRHPGALLAAANALVSEAAGGDEMVSAALFVLDGVRRTIRMANAGQIAPLAVGRSGGVVALEGHGPALGLLPDVDYKDAGPLRLAPGRAGRSPPSASSDRARSSAACSTRSSATRRPTRPTTAARSRSASRRRHPPQSRALAVHFRA
jgi:hypothetical protein